MNSQFKHRLRRAQQHPSSSRSDTDDILDNPFDVTQLSPARRLFATAADIQPPSSASTATGSVFGDTTAISSRASSPSSSSTPPLLGPAFSATGSPFSSPRKRKRSANNASPDRFIPVAATGPYGLLDDSTTNGGLGSAFSGPSTPSKSQTKRFMEMDAQTDQANQAFNEALSSELFPSSSASSSASGSRSPVRSPVRPSNVIGSVATNGTTIISTSSPHRHQVHHTASSPHRPPQTPTRSRLLSFESPKSANRTTRGNGPVFSSSGIALNAGRGLDSPRHEMYNTSPIRESTQDVLLSQRKLIRPVAKTPFKVLDAPDLMDDFYLNLVDWSSTNVLAVGLASCVYLWSANTSKVVKLCDLEGDNVSGLAWERNGSYLAIGTHQGKIQIWDTEQIKHVRTYENHTGRVGALSWSLSSPLSPGAAFHSNGNSSATLTSGSRDHSIVHRDLRAPEDSYLRLSGHRQEICGLKWNSEGTQLASGGNDNKLLVWDAAWMGASGRGAGRNASRTAFRDGEVDAQPLWRFHEHQAAVKALAWSPHTSGLLVSGGGTQDKTIRTWNTANGQLVNWLDTGSQICNLTWSKTTNEIVSTHGYSSTKAQHQVCIWRYPSMDTTATLSGHTCRVLYLAMSPDGETIVTGAGDETLRFWHAFPKMKTVDKQDGIVDFLGRDEVIR
ncbi:substrate-specific activator of APC-dependent proteolysis [Tulasnella sp. JGI-2019a]|nr:substrate-specific activator of APC-dependent proteolysis [Tulasnella sp. JGI-2019a]KAG8990298.1 substrate-specific activator of APC-dependent proteolysis [Tulasnella sp. JGI-2019a]